MERIAEFRRELRKLADAEKASVLARFFKTGKGEYGYGDKFLGVTVPKQRALIKNFLDLRSEDLGKLLDSAWHEERLGALLILVKQYGAAGRGKADRRGRAVEAAAGITDAERRAEIFKFYLARAGRINNWDLVDLSAPNIAGDYLWRLKASGRDKEARAILNKLAGSRNLWERRIAMLATFTFIRAGRFDESLKLAEKFLNDPEPLIHKATGWMLREIGKRDVGVLRDFLNRHGRKMPRTALRYAIERLKEGDRKGYLAKA